MKVSGTDRRTNRSLVKGLFTEGRWNCLDARFRKAPCWGNYLFELCFLFCPNVKRGFR